MKPRLLNRICAQPAIVTCTLGGCALDAVVFCSLLREAPLRAIAPDWQWMLYLLAAFVPAATLLGSLFGTMLLSAPVEIVCRKVNGGPLNAGDKVIVLSGPRKGTIAVVYETSRGQAPWEQLARVDLGIEPKEERPHDVFADYSLLKIKENEQVDSP